jgi:hypothetical protein
LNRYLDKWLIAEGNSSGSSARQERGDHRRLAIEITLARFPSDVGLRTQTSMAPHNALLKAHFLTTLPNRALQAMAGTATGYGVDRSGAARQAIGGFRFCPSGLSAFGIDATYRAFEGSNSSRTEMDQIRPPTVRLRDFTYEAVLLIATGVSVSETCRKAVWNDATRSSGATVPSGTAWLGGDGFRFGRCQTHAVQGLFRSRKWTS